MGADNSLFNGVFFALGRSCVLVVMEAAEMKKKRRIRRKKVICSPKGRIRRKDEYRGKNKEIKIESHRVEGALELDFSGGQICFYVWPAHRCYNLVNELLRNEDYVVIMNNF